MFLGGVMKGTGNKPPATLAQRGVFMNSDLSRNGGLFNVSLLPMPSNFFSSVARDVLQCQRLLVAAQLEKIDIVPLIDSITDGIHVDKGNRNEENELTIDEAFLRNCCGRAGLSGEMTQKLLDSRGSEAVKKQLAENTESAMEQGVYGSPTMIIEKEGMEPMFVFGSDRFEQIAFVCGLPYYGPDPNRPTVSRI